MNAPLEAMRDPGICSSTIPTERFAFKAECWGEGEGWWSVWLPHRCGDWNISKDGCGRQTKAAVLADLDAFIAEAQEARRRIDLEELEVSV